MEKLGLVILKDENGKYVARGNRNIKINGENIKPILASAVEALEGVSVINRLNITDYIVKDGRILGAVGFNIDDGYAYEIRAKRYYVQQVVRQDFISLIIRAFQDIRCGILHLIQEPDMLWVSMLVRR